MSAGPTSWWGGGVAVCVLVGGVGGPGVWYAYQLVIFGCWDARTRVDSLPDCFRSWPGYVGLDFIGLV